MSRCSKAVYSHKINRQRTSFKHPKGMQPPFSNVPVKPSEERVKHIAVNVSKPYYGGSNQRRDRFTCQRRYQPKNPRLNLKKNPNPKRQSKQSGKLHQRSPKYRNSIEQAKNALNRVSILISVRAKTAKRTRFHSRKPKRSPPAVLADQ